MKAFVRSGPMWLLPLCGLSLECAGGGGALPRSDALSPPKTMATPAPPTPENRVEDLLRRMTLDEKIDYLGGERSLFIRGLDRLGIPEIKMSDGPAGCRHWGPSTAYPAPLALAATFDVALAERVGAALGRDCRARGVHILLAPGMNIHRSPLGGRNFEYLGEDPLLAGKTAAAFIRGVQGEGVLATAKHFAGNNQEWDRNHVSSEIDPRTLREIYFPAFERAVKEGHVGAVMTAYNLLNGTYCSHSPWLIRQVLEKEWGFSGFVMSDWGAVHDTVGAIDGGCDLEMPSAEYMNRQQIMPLLDQHRVDAAAIDEMVRRILSTLVRAGFFDRPQKIDAPLDDPASAAVALDEAARSVVLLKNTAGLLPLDKGATKTIAVIGPNAEPAVLGGAGSAYTHPFHAVSLLAGIKQAAPSVVVDYHPGVRRSSEYGLLGRPVFHGSVHQELFAGRDLHGKPVSTTEVDRIDYRPDGGPPESPLAPGAPTTDFSVRWTGELLAPREAVYRFITNTDDGVRVLVDDKRIIDDWTAHAATMHAESLRVSRGAHKIRVEYFQGSGGAVAQFGMGPEARAAEFEGGAEVSALARRADVVILCLGFGQAANSNSAHTAFAARWPPAWARQAGLVEAEDSDRPFELPAAQIETARLVTDANPKTVLVVDAGGAVDLQRIADKVPALLWSFYLGQEGGRALAGVLFGDVNPSGKLPVSFAKRYADYPSAPYYNLNLAGKTPYTEGIFVGYRGLDARGVEPMFPFGFGLSYTRFVYSDLEVAPLPDGSVKVTTTVKNVGARAGDEIVEVYIAPPKEAVPRPPKELAGYARVALAPGEAQLASITLEPRAFAYWDERAREGAWTVEAGTYQVLVGASSADIRASKSVEVRSRVLPP
jgi:beta-glucosidase